MRRCTAEDVPWLLGLAIGRYGTKLKDVDGTRRWLLHVIGGADMVVIRSDAAALIAGLQNRFYDPQPECRVLFVATTSPSPWQLVRLFREMKAWAETKNCPIITIRPELPVDFGPIAKALGKTVYCPGYVVEL